MSFFNLFKKKPAVYLVSYMFTFDHSTDEKQRPSFGSMPIIMSNGKWSPNDTTEVINTIKRTLDNNKYLKNMEYQTQTVVILSVFKMDGNFTDNNIENQETTMSLKDYLIDNKRCR